MKISLSFSAFVKTHFKRANLIFLQFFFLIEQPLRGCHLTPYFSLSFFPSCSYFVSLSLSSHVLSQPITKPWPPTIFQQHALDEGGHSLPKRPQEDHHQLAVVGLKSPMILNATTSFQLLSRYRRGSSLVDLGIFGLHLSFALRWHMVFPISSPLIGTHILKIDVEMEFSDRDVTLSEGWYHVIPFFVFVVLIYNMPSFGASIENHVLQELTIPSMMPRFLCKAIQGLKLRTEIILGLVSTP